MGNGNFAGLACRIIHGETEYGDLLGEVRGATLGGSTGVSTLGRLGEGMWVWARDGGARRRHESKRLHRFAMASSCVMHVGGGASLRAPAMPWRPWMILSSGVGEGMVR